MPNDAIDATKQDAIFDFIVAATGLAEEKVIWAMPDIERPVVPYITMNISSGPRKTGAAEVRFEGTQDTFKYPMRKEITLTVNSYSQSGWLATLGGIVDALEIPTKQQILRDAGIAIITSEDPVDVSALLNDEHEGRGSVDIMLAYCDIVNDISGEIESVKIDQTVGTFESSQTIDGGP